ncbi:InlB B-repeat-containing protein [bacterium]|nr:InlB B-repeat-containing protein [bacterium]
MILAKGSTGEQTFTANWTVNQYTITFNTDGGTKIKSITQDFGTVLPEITNPTKEGYTFAGWEEGELPETMQAENLTFTAKWSINSYEITWKNSNGETLKVEELDYGTMPSYNGSTPEKEADKQYTYTFSHWEPVVKKVEKNQTYTAIYSKTVNQYLITFKNQNNETISTGSYPYGTDIINVVSPEPPFQTGYKFV